MNRYDCVGGALCRHVDDGSYAGSHEHADFVPEGATVEYWRCGSDRYADFVMPPVGGRVTLRHLGGRDRLAFGPHHFTAGTAIGDTPDSVGVFQRIS